MQRRPSDTENKLLLLYTLDSLGPATAQQLLLFGAETGEIGYISVQLGLAELVDSQFLRKQKHPIGALYLLTGKGHDTLQMFASRIPHSRKETVDLLSESWKKRFRQEQQLPASIYRSASNEYRVRLQLIERDEALLDIAVIVPTHKEAERFCNAWIQQASGVYEHLMHALGEGNTEPPHSDDA